MVKEFSMSPKKISVAIREEDKIILDQLAAEYGQKLIEYVGWIVKRLDSMTKTERALFFGLVDKEDEAGISEIILQRRRSSGTTRSCDTGTAADADRIMDEGQAALRAAGRKRKAKGA